MRRFFFGLCLVALLFAGLTVWQGPHGKVTAVGTLTSLVQQSQNSSDIEGKPTIGASLINTVLEASGSPAKGTGQALYDLGVKYGIDPVYALAFFGHESQFGTTGVATVTHSLGNIKCSSGYSCIEGFRSYSSWQDGYEDWYKLIRNLYISQWHLSTVEQIIPRYAPASDHNDVGGYIAAIENAVRTWRGEASKTAHSDVKLAA